MAHRQHLKRRGLPNGVVLLGKKKKILFSFGTCTSSITSCIPLQVLAGGGGGSYSWNTSSSRELLKFVAARQCVDPTKMELYV